MVTKTLSRYFWFVVLLTLLDTSLCGKDTKNGLTEENAQVTVSVYNPADVPGEVLSRAEQTASRIFQRAGIEVNWLNCQMPAASEEASRACRELAFPTHLHLRIVRKSAGLKGEAMGISFQGQDRKSTRLNSSHGYISYAVFCLKKKTQDHVSAVSNYPEPKYTYYPHLPTTPSLGGHVRDYRPHLTKTNSP